MIGRPIAEHLRATRTRTRSRLELRWTYDARGEKEHAQPPATGFARPVVRSEVVLRVGPAPTQISLITRETDRFVEDCTYPPLQPFRAPSCHPTLPTCVRRGER